MRFTDHPESTAPARRHSPAAAAASGRRASEVHTCNARTGRYRRRQAYDPFATPVCRASNQLVRIMLRRLDPSSIGPDCQALSGKRNRSRRFPGVSGRSDRPGNPPSRGRIYASGLSRTGFGPVSYSALRRLYCPILDPSMRTVRISPTTFAAYAAPGSRLVVVVDTGIETVLRCRDARAIDTMPKREKYPGVLTWSRQSAGSRWFDANVDDTSHPSNACVVFLDQDWALGGVVERWTVVCFSVRN